MVVLFRQCADAPSADFPASSIRSVGKRAVAHRGRARLRVHSDRAGIIHALTLLVILLIAAPLARFIPLATLSAVLAVVAYNKEIDPAEPELGLRRAGNPETVQ